MQKLTRKERKKLIDFDTVTHDRHDYTLILFCSRIIIRIQLKCFEDSETFSNNDINDIVRKEADNFTKKLAGFSLKMKINHINFNINTTLLDFTHQISSSKNPLKTISDILNKELSTKPRKIIPPHIRNVYKNLIGLTDDLRNYFVNHKNNNNKIRNIYFLDNYYLYQEGTPGGEDETFISLPVALVWLPTLTIKDEINQKNASAFHLRKKPEFCNEKPTFRSQLLRINAVQNRVNKNKSESSESRNEETHKRRIYKSRRVQSIKYSPIPSIERRRTKRSDCEYQTLEKPPMTSISAILNHVDVESDNKAPTWQHLPYYDISFSTPQNLDECRICSSSMKKFDFRQLCPCILKD